MHEREPFSRSAESAGKRSALAAQAVRGSEPKTRWESAFRSGRSEGSEQVERGRAAVELRRGALDPGSSFGPAGEERRRNVCTEQENDELRRSVADSDGKVRCAAFAVVCIVRLASLRLIAMLRLLGPVVVHRMGVPILRLALIGEVGEFKDIVAVAIVVVDWRQSNLKVRSFAGQVIGQSAALVIVRKGVQGEVNRRDGHRSRHKDESSDH